MRHVVILFGSLALALWIIAPSTAHAATTPKAKSPVAMGKLSPSSHAAIMLKDKDGDEVKVPKDKPKRSKKNDDKDDDPDDGNAGGGNDNKTLPNDGPKKD